MAGEPFEKRFLDLYTVIADAPSLDEALQRLTQFSRTLLGAESVRVSLDAPPQKAADEIISLAEPGCGAPWLHLAITWGKSRRADPSVLRSHRGSLALLVPFLAQRRRLDHALQHLDEPAIPGLSRLESSLEETVLHRLLQKLVERAVREVRGGGGAILLPDPGSSGVTLQATAYVGTLAIDPATLPRVLYRRNTGASRPGAERRRSASACDLFFLVLDQRIPYRTGNLGGDTHVLSLFKGSRSTLTVPLILGGSALGVLTVESPEPEAFGTQEEHRLTEFAQSAAALIAKTSTYEQTRTEEPLQTLRLFGFSPAILARAHEVAAASRPLLITGETGTGKEMLARYVHRMSATASGPFKGMEVSALQNNGTQKYDDATLFFDDVDHLPRASQEFLATFVRAQKNVRIVAASCGGALAPALTQVFAGAEIVLPPLRERPDAIVSLARLILREIADERGGRHKLLSAPTIEALIRYPFPGNLRELREVIETAAASAEGPVLQPFHLPPKVLGQPDTGRRTKSFRTMQEETERAYLTDLLSRTRGDLNEAARQAGLDKNELQALVRKHALQPGHYEPTPSARR